ncbi:ArnT family glycosyltransferase [Helicobacter canis]|uniref:Uncharacterized protein n=1 Tax=Helicobacter canis TaxID=29419 RepID=A0A5M9QI21_9HELI|nr:glycosyltransferase family 39 protein [Helicobacter canis]KAA8707820.1 hypothetical protein F4V45_08110 [Helicobacter canis]
MRKITKNLALYALMAVCFGVFCYMGWRYVDVEFLALTNGDAMPQFLQLQKMYQGLTTLNIKQFFAFEFYNYGFFYYMLNLLAALPFIITESYSLQIYAPRVLNALFSIANIWLLYRIARIYLSALDSMLIAGIFVAMGGFWHLGYVFKPDVFQAFFVLACAYYLLRDNFSFGKHYTLAWIALGLGIGLAKFQAILFIPMMYAYICLPALSMQAGQILLALKRCALGTLGIIALWILSNPYLLHKSGFNAWLSMFEGNMRSNATNHGAYTQVPLSEKLSQVIELYYFEIVVFIVLLAAGLYCCIIALQWLIWQSPRALDSSKQDSMQQPYTQAESICIAFAPLAVGFFISLVYLLLFVNKAWEAYYFSTMALGCVLFIPLALLVAKTSKGGGAAHKEKEALSNHCPIALACTTDSRRAYV